mgnify:CR=1 FL=1
MEYKSNILENLTPDFIQLSPSIKVDVINDRVAVGPIQGATFISRFIVKSTGDSDNQIVLQHSGNGVPIVGIGQESSHGSLQLRLNSGATKVRLSAINDNYIMPNLGIAMTNPSARLDINSNISSSSLAVIKLSQATNGAIKAAASLGISIQNGGEATNAADLWFQTALNGSLEERMRIMSSGNVGINNTSPAKKLEISSPTSGDGIFLTGDGTGGGMSTGSSRNIEFAYTDTDTSYSSAIKFEVPDSAIHGGQISFWTDSLTTSPAGQLVRAMTIDRKQNVGIGTSTPLARLDIQGTQGQLFSVTDDLSGEIFAVADISGVPIMSINSNGRTTFAGSIVLDDQPAASTASGSGTIVNWTQSAPLNVGQVYAVKTDGGWTNATQNTATARLMLGYSLGTNANQGMLLQGFFYKPAHGFSIGTPLYIGSSQGTLTTVAPTGAGDFVRIIGYATSTDYIYFDPDKTWIELT